MALINFDQLGKQLTDWGGDYDVFGDVSVNGGARDATPHFTKGAAGNVTGFSLQGQTKPGYDSTGRKVQNNTAPNNKTTNAPNITTNNNGGGGGGGGGATSAAAAQAAKDAAERNALLQEINGMSPRAQALFADVFNRIKAVASDRKSKVDKTYNDQDAGYVDTFGKAVPQIDNAFAALGIGNSTYAGDRIDEAKSALDTSLAKSKENRQADLAEVGNWEASQRGAFEADQANINDAVGRAGGVQDVSTLRDARNNLTTTVNNISGKRQALNDDGGAIASLNARTGRSANFDSAMKSLEGVLASSMDVGTKNAAKQALIDNAGLDDEEKKKLSEIQVNNPYGAPVA